VHNATKERLVIWLKYYTVQNRDWAWVPKGPQEKQIAKFTFEPGQHAPLHFRGAPVSAVYVRIFARSESGVEWKTHWAEDCWLVTETNKDGEAVYSADQIESYTYTFTP
jgi:hypothetical protein